MIAGEHGLDAILKVGVRNAGLRLEPALFHAMPCALRFDEAEHRQRLVVAGEAGFVLRPVTRRLNDARQSTRHDHLQSRRFFSQRDRRQDREDGDQGSHEPV